MYEYFSRNLDLARLRDHDLCVCGTSLTACALIKFLNENGYRVKWWAGKAFEGVDDQRLTLYGIKICGLSQVSRIACDVSYCIIACEHSGEANRFLKTLSSSLPAVKLENRLEAYIDISGRCQLRCPSCQVANHDPSSLNYDQRGMMEPELFKKIMTKLKADYPDLLSVCLFNYGEPLLSSHLPQCIRYVHEMGLICVISTNLSVKADLESILQAKPDVLKVSVSGYKQEVYESTHTGGSIQLVLNQMRRVSDLLRDQKKSSEVLVAVGYHLYNNNEAEDYVSMKQVCERLGFLFQPIEAMFCNIPKLTGYDRLTEEDIRFIRKYYRNPTKVLNRRSTGSVSEICGNEKNRIFIDYDGTVLLCCLVLHKDGMYRSYLDVTPQMINEWRRKNPICMKCKLAGLAARD